MSRMSWIAWVWAGSLVLPLPAYGQGVRERQGDDIEPPADQAAPAEGQPELAKVVKQIVTATNQFRKENKRGDLKVNSKLTDTATYFAKFMARTDKFSHTADGNQPWDRAAKQDYEYCIILENIAWEFNSAGFTTEALAKGFVKGWKESPGHRKNLLDKDVTEIGVAVARSKDSGKYYAAQVFGRPKSDEITFKITNQTEATLRYTLDGKDQSLEPRNTVTHHRCRPPEVHFQLPGEKKATEEEATFHPTHGAQYVVRSDEAGMVTVEKK